MANQDVKFVMAVDDQGFIRKMTEAERVLYETQKTAGKAHDTFSQLFRGFVSGQIVVDAIRKGFSLLKNEMMSTVGEAIESEQAQRRLATALELTGRAGAGTMRELLAFANAQQKVTLYTDEEIELTMALLAQMTKLDTIGLQKATKGVMGLATVMDTNLESATRRVMAAIAGGSEGLARYGIHIDDTLSRHEKEISLLDQLVALYPRATAETESFGGQLSQLKKAWRELKEEMGRVVTESTAIKSFIQDQTEYLRSFNSETKESAFSWQAIYRAMSGGNIAGIIASTAAAQAEAQAKARDLDAEIRALASDFMTGLRPSVEASTVALRAISAATVDARKAFEDLSKLNLERLSPFDELMEAEPGSLFGEGKEFENPFQEMLDQWLSTAHGYTLILKGMTKTTRTETDRQTDYFAGLYNDMARGFANVFMQFRLTTEGFKNFFIGMWQEIKRAFFTILAEMLARWLATAFVRFLMTAFTGPAMPLMEGVGGILPIPAQHGFQGVVNRPTLFLAGEAGPERVNISPTNRGGGGATINVNIYSWDNASMESAVRHRVVPILQEVMAHGDL